MGEEGEDTKIKCWFFKSGSAEEWMVEGVRGCEGEGCSICGWILIKRRV